MAMQDEQIRENPAVRVSNIIRDIMRHAAENSLQNDTGEPAWDEPLVGFSRGDDPLYRQCKDDIGEFYWTPAEIFRKTFHAEPQGLTVISWILPQTKATKTDNRKAKIYPSERWSRSRLFGEQANLALANHVVNTLQEADVRTVAPERSPPWQWQTSERYGFSSYGCGLCQAGVPCESRIPK